MKKTLKNGIEVTGKPWEGYGKERIYFALDLGESAGSGSKNKNVCWDITKQEWVSCSYEWEPDNATWEDVRDQLYVAFGKEMGLPQEEQEEVQEEQEIQSLSEIVAYIRSHKIEKIFRYSEPKNFEEVVTLKGLKVDSRDYNINKLNREVFKKEEVEVTISKNHIHSHQDGWYPLWITDTHMEYYIKFQEDA